MTFDISVVIPLYRAASYLPALLKHLERQTLSLARFEVILVDDLSPDDTRLVVAELGRASSLNLRLVEREINGGVSAARNTGWRLAQAPLIVFIDQDCLADPGLLASHYQASQTDQPCAWIGRIVWSKDYQENPASEHYKAGYFPSWDSYKAEASNFQLFITSNASVTKAALEEIGGFDEPFRHNYEDVTCGYRLEQAGYSIKRCPDALIYHHRPLPVAEMFRRTFVAGREMARLFQHYPALIGHWWLLNPAQALDWGYRLATLETLLSATLDRLDVAGLSELEPFLTTVGQYLVDQPFLHLVDQPYLKVLTAQRVYQRELDKVGWLESCFMLAGGRPRGLGLGGRLSGIKRMLAKVWPGRETKLSTEQSSPRFSVLAVVHELITPAEWQRFLAGLADQRYRDFELVTVAVPDKMELVGQSQKEQPFPTIVYPIEKAAEGLRKAAGLASGDWLISLAADSVPAAGWLEAYARQSDIQAVLIGQELPLGRTHPGQAAFIPPLLDLSHLEIKKVHHTAFSTLNTAVPRPVYSRAPELFDPSFSGGLADLLTGWQLATSGQAEFIMVPQAVSYASQTKRIAQRMLDYPQRPARLSLLHERYPVLAQIYDGLKRPAPSPSDLILLYDTFKEYPFSAGLLQGLTDQFGIVDLPTLKNHPLFSALCARWESDRAEYLEAQLLRLAQGQIELDRYSQHLEAQTRSIG